jgi:hypothetical protein
MSRILLCLAALPFMAVPCLADEANPTPETLIRLSVEPASAPKPALRYQLLPEFKEMNPGNPIQNYLKCFMEQQKFFFDKEAVARRENLSTMPLEELPAGELQNYGGSALVQADWAARLDNPDWQIMLLLKAHGIQTLIPDVQELRTLAGALKVRFRAEVALGRFDEALRTAKTLFAMSRHLGEHPTFVGDLVGIAIANVAIGPLEEMLQQPGCPNLYWALTFLPTPLVPLDKAAAGELDWLRPTFRELDDSQTMSPEQIERFIGPLSGLLAGDNDPSGGDMRTWLDARNRDEKLISTARQHLVESGIPRERLTRFSADQVILLDEKRKCEELHADVIKLVNLPVWQVEALSKRISSNREPVLFDLAPAIAKVRRAQARLDQRIALLRYVEALRLYAAEHEGMLPALPSEISVPLPDDPFTGKPFRYELNDDTAQIRGSAPAGEEKNPALNVRYEVAVKKMPTR